MFVIDLGLMSKNWRIHQMLSVFYTIITAISAFRTCTFAVCNFLLFENIDPFHC